MDVYLYNAKRIKQRWREQNYRNLSHLSEDVKFCRTILTDILKGVPKKRSYADELADVLDMKDANWLLDHTDMPKEDVNLSEIFPRHKYELKFDKGNGNREPSALNNSSTTELTPPDLKCLKEEVFKRGFLRVGIYKGMPYVSYNTKRPTGLFVRMIQKVADNAGLKIKWVKIQVHDFKEALDNKKIDIALGITSTNERESEMFFAGRHFRTPLLAMGSRRFNRYGNIIHLIQSKEKLKWALAKRGAGADFYKQRLEQTIRHQHKEVESPVYLEATDLLRTFDNLRGTSNITIATGEACLKFTKQLREDDDIGFLFNKVPLAIYRRGIALPFRQSAFRQWLSDQCHMVFKSDAFQKTLKRELPKWRGFIATKGTISELDMPYEMDLMDKFNVKNKKATMKIATLDESFTAHEPGGEKYEGFHCKLIRRICERNKITPVFHSIPSNQIVQNIASGKDCHIAVGLADSPIRKQSCDFCGLICSIGVSALYKKDKYPDFNFRKLLRTKSPKLRLGAAVGEIGAEFIEHYLNQKTTQPPLLAITDGTSRGITPNLEDDDIDCIIAASLNCKAWRKVLTNKSQYEISAPLTLCRMGFMIKQGNPRFRSWLNNEANTIIAYESDMREAYIKFLDSHTGHIFDNMLYMPD